jgi:hypothetical protein
VEVLDPSLILPLDDLAREPPLGCNTLSTLHGNRLGYTLLCHRFKFSLGCL